MTGMVQRLERAAYVPRTLDGADFPIISLSRGPEDRTDILGRHRLRNAVR